VRALVFGALSCAAGASTILLLSCSTALVPTGGAPDRPTQGGTIIPDGPGTETPIGPAGTGESGVSIRASKVFCCDPLAVDFEAVLPDGQVVRSASLEWEFGDGFSAMGAIVRHAYGAPGTYYVELRATSGTGQELVATSKLVLNGVTVIQEEYTPQDPSSSDPPGNGDPGDPIGPAGEDDPDDPSPPPGGNGQEPPLNPPPDDPPPGDPPPDPDGEEDPDEDPPPDPPIARAGEDQTVDGGILVILDGSGSSPPDPEMTFRWRELSDSGVHISDAQRARATFTAPVVVGDPLVLEFELRVTLEDLVDTDTLLVTVLPEEEEQEEEEDFPDPFGAPLDFLSGPDGHSPPGRYTVTWRFVDRVGVRNVRLRESCCYNCPGGFSSATLPDERGVYTSEVVVPVDGKASFYNVTYEADGVVYFGQSVYLNVPAGSGAPTPRVIWYHQREIQPAYLGEVLATGVITHVLIGGGDRAADPPDDAQVREVIRVAGLHGVSLIWSRHLWNNWFDFPTMDDVFDPDFYAAAVAQIRQEAAGLGIPLTAIDCEVYSQNPLYNYFLQDLSDDAYQRMDTAIRQAATRGRVDYVLPSGSNGRPKLHLSLYHPIAVSRICTATYYDYPEKNCKIDHPYEVFGAYVNTTTERPDNPLRPYFLPHDLLRRRYLWSAADGAMGGVNGLFIYPGSYDEHVGGLAEMISRHQDGR
jgi:hypothetical protein